MELHQLEYFVAVAEEGSFTRAAERVHVAQPGVSAQIGRLERELGQQLFDRAGRTVRLTEVGAAVLPYARAALGAVGAARQAVDELTGLRTGASRSAWSPPARSPRCSTCSPTSTGSTRPSRSRWPRPARTSWLPHCGTAVSTWR